MNRTRAALLAGAARAVEISGTKITMAQVAAAAGRGEGDALQPLPHPRGRARRAARRPRSTRWSTTQAGKPLADGARRRRHRRSAEHPVRRGRWPASNRPRSPRSAASTPTPRLAARPRRASARCSGRSRPRRRRHRAALAGVLPAHARAAAAAIAADVAVLVGRPARRSRPTAAPRRRRSARPDAAPRWRPAPVRPSASACAATDGRWHGGTGPTSVGRDGETRDGQAESVRPGVEVHVGLVRRQGRREGRPEDPDPAGDRKRRSASTRQLTQQAATVIGNQRQLEMQLDRQLDQVETLQAAGPAGARAGRQGPRRRRRGQGGRVRADRAGAGQPAGQRRVSRSQDLKTLHDQALQAAAAGPRRRSQDNSMMLQEKLTERTKLLTQLEQAKMQETVSASLQQMSELAAPDERADPRRGPRQDREALRRRARPGRPGPGLDRRPDARGQARDRSTCRAPPGWTRSAPRWPAEQAGASRRRRRRAAVEARRPAPPRRRRAAADAEAPTASCSAAAVAATRRLAVAGLAASGTSRCRGARGGAPCSARRIGVRQRRHGWPPRS